MRTAFFATLVAAALGLTAATATAGTSVRDATAEEAAKVASELKKKGYSSISDVDIVDGRFVVDAKSPSGADVDVIVDQISLTIIEERPS